MMGKLISLNNHQGEERIFVVAGCSWYLDKVERMHVSFVCFGVLRPSQQRGHVDRSVNIFWYCSWAGLDLLSG